MSELTLEARAYVRPTIGIGDTVAGVCACHGYRVSGGVVCDIDRGMIQVVEHTFVGDERHALRMSAYCLIETLADTVARQA